MGVIENVRELESKKITFVRSENICKFVALCSVLGVICLGGAFGYGFDGQWFYLDA